MFGGIELQNLDKAVKRRGAHSAMQVDKLVLHSLIAAFPTRWNRNWSYPASACRRVLVKHVLI